MARRWTRHISSYYPRNLPRETGETTKILVRKALDAAEIATVYPQNGTAVVLQSASLLY
jgi:hypothetical protein